MFCDIMYIIAQGQNVSNYLLGPDAALDLGYIRVSIGN